MCGCRVQRGARGARRAQVRIEAAPGWTVAPKGDGLFAVTIAGDAALSTKPYFSRAGLQESRYTLSDPSQFGRPASAPPLVAVARYTVSGAAVEAREVVKRRESKVPYGEVLREVRSVPRIAVTLSPSTAIVPGRHKQTGGRGGGAATQRARRHAGPGDAQDARGLDRAASRAGVLVLPGGRAGVVPVLGAARCRGRPALHHRGRGHRRRQGLPGGYELVDHRDLRCDTSIAPRPRRCAA